MPTLEAIDRRLKHFYDAPTHRENPQVAIEDLVEVIQDIVQLQLKVRDLGLDRAYAKEGLWGCK